MKRVTPLKKGKYVVAVSGGLDSVSLLDMLSRQPGIELIVAHFDHGMRPDSGEDERFVAALAREYGLAYVSERKELGPEASEAAAREARYDFLFRVRNTHAAGSIVTAHHQDDVIETMMINLIRGTGWRGLCSLKDTPGLDRPLLAFNKADILGYAKGQNLSWREDPTNNDQQYLRNAVRHRLMPRADRQTWLELYQNQKKLARSIDHELARLRSLKRYDYIMWPPSVALEAIKRDAALTRVQAGRALLAIKTATSGSAVTVGGKKKLTFTRDTFVVGDLEP